MNLINLADYEALAREKLTETAWDYYAGGAEDERTIADNCQAFRRIKLRPRVLIDVGKRDLTTEVLGQPIAFPVLLGPTTYQRLAHPDAEIASARAAAAAGTIFIVPTEGHYSVREIATAAPGPLWFQLYTFGGRESIAHPKRRAGRLPRLGRHGDRLLRAAPRAPLAPAVAPADGDPVGHA
jgi:isopentenyl diphosphate isomerase/L-lactate dehydrogenase-like FMN-dependent dehydrogenase